MQEMSIKVKVKEFQKKNVNRSLNESLSGNMA